MVSETESVSQSGLMNSIMNPSMGLASSTLELDCGD